MKSFDVPIIYRSPLITAIKKKRKEQDKMKKDFTPTLLNFGPLQVYLARHFGFCYGVENAIEIAFRTVDENPGKRIFLLSEMIHNPQVNADLQAHGVQFMQDNYGKQLISFNELRPDDIVIIPAFGTTLELEEKLNKIGIQTEKYDTTCPFVEKVWNRSEQIAKKKLHSHHSRQTKARRNKGNFFSCGFFCTGSHRKRYEPSYTTGKVYQRSKTACTIL